MLGFLLSLPLQVFMFLYVSRHKFFDFRRVYFSVFTVTDLGKIKMFYNYIYNETQSNLTVAFLSVDSAGVTEEHVRTNERTQATI